MKSFPFFFYVFLALSLIPQMSVGSPLDIFEEFEFQASRPFESFPEMESLRECKQEARCNDYREAAIEFLLQFSDEIPQFKSAGIYQNLFSNSVVPFTDEQGLDLVLLSRKLKSVYPNIDPDTDLLLEFPERACAYRNLLTENELSLLACGSFFKEQAKPKDLEDLIYSNLKSSTERTQLFMFCREDRQFPCYMILKKLDNELYQLGGEVWGQPALGYSRKKKPAHKRDGDTPEGVLLVNSVMPEANRQSVFGNYRRLILDFVSDEKVASYLPESHRNQSWWAEAQVAQRVGRKYLRIHGTGMKNRRPDKSYYPFVGTRGCVAQRENLYADLGEDFTDQNHLLQALMLAQGLEPIYEMHTSIRSVLYVVDISDEKRSVSRDDVISLLR